ncbi:MAG TPA: sigma-70 family RNA polymerase sigma factor [Vicinamibacterales bacterium]|jgi:RNA polymerase sigma-70 factor (ECF subfamily)|nr:sigma-70 family RNA polymerase sigma factor [Vicinamibacterales bacterium]
MAETTKNLVDRLKAHDPSAVAELSNSYGSKVYQLAFRYLKNREDAEEVAQDVLLKVYQKIDAFRGDSALSSWIYRITFNAAMSRLREFKQNLPAAPELARDNDAARPVTRDVVDWSPLADEEVFRAELRRTLVDALKDLPALYRTPVILRDVQGLSTEEASAILHVKEQTLKSRLHRGRLMLREQLSTFAGGLQLH